MANSAQAQRVRYADYHRLLDVTGEKPQTGRWQAHRRELREQLGEPADRRLTKQELAAWWRERFTQAEIVAMASGVEL